MKRATLKDVAERAGVSKATVSYILNNADKPITEETRLKVKKAMEELQYVPNLGAASLTSKTSKMIGVVIPQTEPGSQLMFQNSFYSEIISSIEYHARKIGYHILISGTDVDESYMKLIYERNLDAVFHAGLFLPCRIRSAPSMRPHVSSIRRPSHSRSIRTRSVLPGPPFR